MRHGLLLLHRMDVFDIAGSAGSFDLLSPEGSDWNEYPQVRDPLLSSS